MRVRGGKIYLAEAGGGRVIRFAEGKPKTVIGSLQRPKGIAIARAISSMSSIPFHRVDPNPILRSVPAGPSPRTYQSVLQLGGVGGLCDPIYTLTGITVAADGTPFVSGDADGSVFGFASVQR